MRDKFDTSLKDAMRARNKRRVATLRLIMAAIKDRDIDARGEGREEISDQDILALLQKMVKQRQESAKIYAEAGRNELAEQEREEIAIIEEFLPQPMSQSDIAAAIDAAIVESSAAGLRDMGKVVATLKAKYPGRIDFGQAAKLVKEKLSS